jgi:hypothetical protein
VGLALALVACQQPASAPTGVRARVEAEQRDARLKVLGERRIAGQVQELRASPDGAWVTGLVEAERPQVEGVSPLLRVGVLWIAGVNTAQARPVASGVSNQPGGVLATADSRWLLVLSGWDPRTQQGTLLVVDPRGELPEGPPVGGRVSYFVPSDDGRSLAWVAEGVLSVGPLPGGPWRQVASEVSTAEFSSDGSTLYFRRRFTAAGGLYQVALGGPGAEPRRVIDRVADYTVLPPAGPIVVSARAAPGDRTFGLWVIDGGTLRARKVADDAQHFRVSPDGRLLAWRTASVRRAVTADVGQLWLAALKGGPARQLGELVKDFEFSPDSRRLVFRDHFQELPLGGREAKRGEARLEKVGDLTEVRLPDGPPRVLQRLSPNFLFAPDGKALAYTGRIEEPEVTRRLFLQGSDGPPVALQDWLYEYQFRPPGSELFYRADCIREGRACAVLAVPVAKPGTRPRKEADGVFGLRFAADGSRVLLASAHLTDLTFDLTAKDLVGGASVSVDQAVEWPALILGPHGDHVAYLVREPARPGLYIARLP